MKKIIISIYPSVRNKIFQIYLSDLTGSTQGVSSLRKGVWCMKTSSFSSSSVLIHTGKVSIFVWKKKHFAQVFTGQQGGGLKIVVPVNFLLLFLFKWNQLHIFFTIRFSNFKNIYSFSLLRNKSKIINMIKSIMIQPRCYGCSPGSNLDFFKNYFIVIKITFIIVSFIYMYD